MVGIGPWRTRMRVGNRHFYILRNDCAHQVRWKGSRSCGVHLGFLSKRGPLTKHPRHSLCPAPDMAILGDTHIGTVNARECIGNTHFGPLQEVGKTQFFLHCVVSPVCFLYHPHGTLYF